VAVRWAPAIMGRVSSKQVEPPEPEFEVPEFEVPEFEVPEFEVPEFEVPEFGVPELAEPDFEEPNFEEPGLGEQPGLAEPGLQESAPQVEPHKPAAVDEPPTFTQATTSGLRLVIVTGMSGAGRSTAANALEDLGWYVVDNLPPSLLTQVCAQAIENGLTKVAVVLDVRMRPFFEQLATMFSDLSHAHTLPEILFLEASDDVIVRRQESVRRPHPLQGDGRLLDGITRERETLATLRAAADLVVDTSALNVHQLSSRISHTYGGEGDEQLKVTLVSFGFKNGIPVDADLVMDVRFLPNPHWVPELRPQTGLSRVVSDYVLGQPGAEAFLQRLLELVQVMATGYLQEGKRFVTIAIGCTGGKHRSTAMAEEFGRRLRELGLATKVLHRDLGRE
jgi:RNase adapter protein RapZ